MRRQTLFLGGLGVAILLVLLHRPKVSPLSAGSTQQRHDLHSSSFEAHVAEAVAKADRIVHWHGKPKLNHVINRFWKGNAFCDEMGEEGIEPGGSVSVLLNITFGCEDLLSSMLGTGNFMSLFYAIRLTARLWGNVDVLMTCSDATDQRHALILPWLMGLHLESQATRTQLPTIEKACERYHLHPTGYMLREMQYDLRRMAVGLVGYLSADNEAARHFAEESMKKDHATTIHQVPNSPIELLPLYPEIELDDVAIHFRCGDLMSSGHKGFAFMKFYDFSRHISSEARSIGILTQPFEKTGGQQRADDGVNGDRCRIVVNGLVDYLTDRHPQARLRVHNQLNETMALSYARMILANQTIAGISSFGVFGPIANFGMGYVRKPGTSRGMRSKDYAKGSPLRRLRRRSKHVALESRRRGSPRSQYCFVRCTESTTGARGLEDVAARSVGRDCTGVVPNRSAERVTTRSIRYNNIYSFFGGSLVIFPIATVFPSVLSVKRPKH